MDAELKQKIEGMEAQIFEMSKTVKKLNNYFKWTAIITVVLFVVPLIGLMFAIPSFIKTIDSETSLTSF